MALIAQAATLESRVPFLHFFDGFRTSHEVNKIVPLSDEDFRAMIDEESVLAHRERALTPDRPSCAERRRIPMCSSRRVRPAIRTTCACPAIVQDVMDRFAEQTGPQVPPVRLRRGARRGARDHPDGIGCGRGRRGDQVSGTAQGEKLGLLKVRMYRPFAAEAFLAALPPRCKSIAVLDRTKEPGALGEPLYQDVVTALS